MPQIWIAEAMLQQKGCLSSIVPLRLEVAHNEGWNLLEITVV
ncbi:MAG: hypothetical protein WHX60_07530 [Armatimonadota bacterium]